jgi:hypothetical protein
VNAEPQAFSISEFCEVHGISRGLYYKLEAEGRAPAAMEVNRRRLISKEEAARWREMMTVHSKSHPQAA